MGPDYLGEGAIIINEKSGSSLKQDFLRQQTESSSHDLQNRKLENGEPAKSASRFLGPQEKLKTSVLTGILIQLKWTKTKYFFLQEWVVVNGPGRRQCRR